MLEFLAGEPEGDLMPTGRQCEARAENAEKTPHCWPQREEVVVSREQRDQTPEAGKAQGQMGSPPPVEEGRPAASFISTMCNPFWTSDQQNCEKIHVSYFKAPSCGFHRSHRKLMRSVSSSLDTKLSPGGQGVNLLALGRDAVNTCEWMSEWRKEWMNGFQSCWSYLDYHQVEETQSSNSLWGTTGSVYPHTVALVLRCYCSRILEMEVG